MAKRNGSAAGRSKSPRLRWNPREKCWRYRRTIEGKEHAYWVGRGGSGPDDQVAYARAVQEALLKEELLTGGQEIREFAAKHTEQLEEVLLQVEDLHRFFSRPFREVRERLIVDKDIPELLRQAWRASILQEVIELKDAEIAGLREVLAAHGRVAVTDANAKLEDIKSKWIESVRNEKKSSKQSSGHIASFMTNIEPFIEFLAENDPQIVVTRELEANWRAVADYREHIIEEMHERGLSKGWAKGRLDKARLFCEYLVKNAYLTTLPRAIDRHWSRIGKDDPSPTFFTLKEIHTLWDHPNDRMRLVMALGLNAGYRAADIRTLERDAVDFKRGEIRRQRNKTGAAQVHKLWPVTKTLLKQHLDGTPDPLPFSKGYSNISRELTAFVDHVLTKEKNEDPRRTAKSFRSTGAQELEYIIGGISPHVIDQYLAHGDKKVARHYRKQELMALYEALDKLNERFNLDEPRKVKKKRASKRHGRCG